MANFGINSLLNTAKSTVTDYLGISSSDVIMSPIWTSRNMASDYFFVTVSSSAQRDEVKFRLPEKFELGMKSTFSSLVEGKLGIVSALNKFIQTASAFTGSMVSLNTKFTTAQLWEGSSPVSISLPIEFNASNDVYKEVYENIIKLGKMALPREGNKGDWTDIFLRAPGPTPLDLANDKVLKGLTDEKKLQSNIKSVEETSWLSDSIKSALKSGINWLASNGKQLQVDSQEAGDNITISIGNILTFKRCIIPEIKWDFDCTRLLNGNGLPLRVTGTMSFRTTTAMTSNDFENALTVNNSSLFDWYKNELDSLKDQATNTINGWIDSGVDKVKNMSVFKDM